jgi:rfaE bifunctional protein nucleotidyltransferase chain/domain
MKRLLDRKELGRAMDGYRRMGRRIVLTNGCFDLLHPGHLTLLRSAAGLGDVLVVAINDDASVRRLKGAGRPIYPAEERAEILLGVRWVDHVTVFAEDTPLATIEIVRPDVLVKGAEYRKKDIVGASLVAGYGGKVVRVPMRKGHSTRLLVRRMTAPRAESGRRGEKDGRSSRIPSPKRTGIVRRERKTG